MKVKIAVGSSDGIEINQHFGSCKKFYVFELLYDGSFNIVDIRESITKETQNLSCHGNNSGCGLGCDFKEIEDESLLNKIKLLIDCDMVLINKIGKSAEKVLLKNGISALEIGGDIEKAISKLFLYYRRTKEL